MHKAGGPGRVYRSEHARRTGRPETSISLPSPPAEPPPAEPSPVEPPPTTDRFTTDEPAGQAAAGPPAGPPPADPPEETGSAAGHSAVMAIGSLVSRVTGFLRTVMIGAALGSTLVGDAYTNAQIFPGMIYELLFGAAVTSVLVPVLVRARRSDPDRGEAYAQRLVTLAVVALGAVTVLAVAAAPLLAMLVAENGDSEGLITALSYLILPTIFFYGMAAILSAVLNTRGHFAAPMWSPILNNLVVIATFGLYLVVFGAEPPTATRLTAGEIALVGGGTLLGIVTQAAGLVPALRRVGFRWRWRSDFRALRLREIGRLAAWMTCYIGANQVAVVVVMKLLNRATSDQQSNAGLLIYNNIFLLMMMAHGIVAVSIITALMPRMSAAAADGRYEDVGAHVSRGIRTASAVLAPIAAAYAVLALPICVTLFQWGGFTAEMARSAAPVLLVTGLILLPFSIGQITTVAFYALQDTRTPALVNVGVVAVRITAQVVLYLLLAASLVAAGMILGNGVSYLVTVAVMGTLLSRRVGGLRLRPIVVTLGKVLVAAGGAALVGWVAVRLLPGGGDPTKPQAILQVVVAGGLLVATYVGLAIPLRLREINEVLDLVRRKLRRA